MKRRRLVSAHLGAKDADLAEWVEELAQEGVLAQAVKAGLRIVRELCSRSGGRDYLSRGILADAFTAGLLHRPGVAAESRSRGPGSEGQRTVRESHSDDESLSQTLDRALGG